MCLIFISFNHHPAYKLIVAANRDEFYARKTSPADFWMEQPNILAGRDLEAMGTWMGVNRQGAISMVTNYRDLQNIRPQAPSRGKLVSDYLAKSDDPESYMAAIAARGKEYNGFNLLVGNAERLLYYSNYREGVADLKPGFYGLSNHLLETPWPKVVRGKELLAPLLNQQRIDPYRILDVLHDGVAAAAESLPDTGIGIEREKALSSMFITTPGYGTRCSTVVSIDRNNTAVFTERVYNTTDLTSATQSFEFRV